jgi:hypothetical protein
LSLSDVYLMFELKFKLGVYFKLVHIYIKLVFQIPFPNKYFFSFSMYVPFVLFLIKVYVPFNANMTNISSNLLRISSISNDKKKLLTAFPEGLHTKKFWWERTLTRKIVEENPFTVRPSVLVHQFVTIVKWNYVSN